MTNTLQTMQQSLQQKRKSKKGFTLMEMLIVVAIIAILVAIAIPVFSAQMENSKEQVDAANLRSATSMAVVDYLTNDSLPTPDSDGNITYVAIYDLKDAKTMAVSTSATAGYYDAQSKTNSGKHIEIKVTTGGKIASAKWN
jgi:type IV pilus assembly protein PilA